MTDAREITVEEIVPCMDAWCKISPCTCRDGINVLIAERDRLFQKLGAMTVERDNLKEEVERLTNLRHYNAEALWKQNDALVERVSVLERRAIEAEETAKCDRQFLDVADKRLAEAHAALKAGIRRTPHGIMVSRDSRIAKVLTAETAAKFLRWCHSLTCRTSEDA
jgi:hypothetical protein